MFVSSFALVFNTKHGVFKCEGNTTDAVSNNKKKICLAASGLVNTFPDTEPCDMWTFCNCMLL